MEISKLSHAPAVSFVVDDHVNVGRNHPAELVCVERVSWRDSLSKDEHLQ